MNERLTALCEQAISEVWESRKGPDGLVRTDGNPYIFYEKFAELVAAHEREECAKVADAWQTEVLNPRYHCDCATAIRRRKD